MNALRSLPLLALAALVACSSAAPTATSPTPAASTLTGDSGWTPHDPQIVRCGIDDRPRDVSSSLPPPPARALLADAAPVPTRRPPPAAAKPAPPPDPDGDIEPEPEEIEIDRLPMSSTSGGQVPASLSSVDPHYDVCLSLAPDSEPLGTVTFGLELAPSGAPLRVLPASSVPPTPFVRCLMERACQLQATASPPGQKLSLAVPLRLHRAHSVVVPPPPPPREEIRVDVVSVKPRPDRSQLQLELRGSAGGAMRSCGPVPGRARVRVSVDLSLPSNARPTRSPRRPRLIVAVVEDRNVRVTGQRTEVVEGTVSTAVLGCVANLLGQNSFLDAGFTPGATLTEQLILTWNP